MNNLLPQEKIDFMVGQKGHCSNGLLSISEASPHTSSRKWITLPIGRKGNTETRMECFSPAYFILSRQTDCLLRLIWVLKCQLTWRFGIRGMEAGEINKCVRSQEKVRDDGCDDVQLRCEGTELNMYMWGMKRGLNSWYSLGAWLPLEIEHTANICQGLRS